MNLRVCAAVAILVFAGACSDPEPSTTGTTPSASATVSEAPAADELVMSPGQIGQVLAGMTVEQARQTGFFEDFEQVPDDPCEGENPPIQWKAPHTETLTVRVDDGAIESLGVREGVETDKGIGVGSTLADVKAAYSGAKVSPSEALGSTVFIQNGDMWLGMAFDEEPDEIKDAAKVLYMEVSLGQKPTTFLSGCG